MESGVPPWCNVCSPKYDKKQTLTLLSYEFRKYQSFFFFSFPPFQSSILVNPINQEDSKSSFTSNSAMLPPITIPVPAGTNAIYLTALSLFDKTSSVSVSWTDGDATFGADFVGPDAQYVLGDKVFGLPIIAFTSIPSEVSVSFDFNDDLTHQHSVSGPVTTRVGPEGDATKVQISGYASSDHHHRSPTTVTILFQGSLPPLTSQK